MLKTELEEKCVEYEEEIESLKNKIVNLEKQVQEEKNQKNYARSALQDEKRKAQQLETQLKKIQQQFETQKNNMEEQLKQNYSSQDLLRKKVLLILEKYIVSYRAFLKSIQGGLENAVEFEATLYEEIQKIVQRKDDING